MPSNQFADNVPTHPMEPVPTTVPRKRRKRTAGGGAADDCFSCTNRGTKCDRRRPYCTQCLDLGKDCSGYKTTLTWGVGVASRGKLRGLSLPVSEGQATPTQKACKQNASSNEVKSPQQSRQASTVFPVERPGSVSAMTTVFTARTTGTVADTPGANLSAGSQADSQWFTELSQPAMIADAPPNTHRMNQPLLYDGLSTRLYLSQPGLTSTNRNFEAPLHSNHIHSSQGHWHGFHTTQSGSSRQSVFPPFINPTEYISDGNVSLESYSASVPPDWPPVVTGKRRATDDESEEDVEQIYGASGVYSNQSPYTTYPQKSLFFVQSAFANSLPDIFLEHSAGRTPRVRYLISYFAEVIAPVIVAFDSPTNPYRTRILQLAQQSETLQHAIAALSASNMRQRREAKILSTERTEPARMSSLAHRALTDTSFQERYGIRDPQDANREELYHKSMAIRSLNAQLADPARRHQDSVLATLLILCLFHICETGVAQFQTQFAGVRKLLAMRNRTGTIQSEEAKWCTRMFTWFDAMTATINNREGQLQGAHLDMACLSDEEWAMENLAGCDGRLFKIIARLGRLNILSQNRPVESFGGEHVPAAVPVLPPSLSHFTMPTPLQSSTFLFDKAADPFGSPQQGTEPGHADTTEFWTEWHSIRQQLEAWRLDTTFFGGGYEQSSVSPSHSWASLSTSASSAKTFMSPLSPPSQYVVAPKNFIDLSNISESFRHSALLYTERLASPDIPSSHPRIQNLVLTALHYISDVHSDVYLLWPLFITGAECVYDEHREAIRQRCKDIQKDSGFFNNISCLELLEKIWAKNPSMPSGNDLSFPLYNPVGGLAGNPVSNVREQGQWSSVSSTTSSKLCLGHPNGFKWRSIIESENLDGEYIVV